MLTVSKQYTPSNTPNTQRAAHNAQQATHNPQHTTLNMATYIRTCLGHALRTPRRQARWPQTDRSWAGACHAYARAGSTCCTSSLAASTPGRSAFTSISWGSTFGFSGFTSGRSCSKWSPRGRKHERNQVDFDRFEASELAFWAGTVPGHIRDAVGWHTGIRGMTKARVYVRSHVDCCVLWVVCCLLRVVCCLLTVMPLTSNLGHDSPIFM